MTLSDFIQLCHDEVTDALELELIQHGVGAVHSITVNINTNCGTAEIRIFEDGSPEVTFTRHDPANDHRECTNLAYAVANGMPAWSDVVDQYLEQYPDTSVYDRHGFIDEFDFYSTIMG